MMKINATIVFQKNWNAVSQGQRYIVNTGSSRSSKTYSLMQLFYLYALQNANKRLSVWRDTKKDCKDTVLNDMRKAYILMPNYDKVSFNKTESIFTFPNGSTIEICGTDDEEKIHGFQGDAIWLNEPYKISRETFDQLDMRCSDFVLIDWNPKKSHWIEDLYHDKRTTLIHSTFRDNPFCPINQKLKILSYDPNNLENVKNRTANRFMWECYGLGLKAELPNKIFHGWNKISDAYFDDLDVTSYYGLDFGSTNPSALVEVKKLHGQTFVKEILYKPISQMNGDIVETLEQMKIPKNRLIVADSADPNRIGDLVIAGFNIVPAHKGQGSVNAGITDLQKEIVNYTENSINFEAEYDEYQWELINGMNLERPIKKKDHAMDAFRYINTYLKYYLK